MQAERWGSESMDSIHSKERWPYFAVISPPALEFGGYRQVTIPQPHIPIQRYALAHTAPETQPAKPEASA